MDKFSNIKRVLRCFFNAKDGLSEDVSIGIYKRSFQSAEGVDNLRRELEQAFADDGFSWTRMLSNEEYEVFDAESEDEARRFARRILWEPMFGASL